jgi:class 3 adenylate cyclase
MMTGLCAPTVVVQEGRLRTFDVDCRLAASALRSAAEARQFPVAREQRKLAAILAADVAGYSRLMGRDESGTLARCARCALPLFEPTLARHGGR